VKLLAQLARNSALELILIVLARSDPRDVTAVALPGPHIRRWSRIFGGPPVYASGGVAEIEEVCYYLDASVFSAAGGAFRLAGYAEYPFSR